MRKKVVYSILMIICLVVHMVFVFISFAYAFWGKYVHNKPANIWPIIWDKTVPFQMLVGLITFILGIIGIVTSKGHRLQTVVSVVLLASIFLGMLSIVYAVGAHF